MVESEFKSRTDGAKLGGRKSNNWGEKKKEKDKRRKKPNVVTSRRPITTGFSPLYTEESTRMGCQEAIWSRRKIATFTYVGSSDSSMSLDKGFFSPRAAIKR